MDKQRSSKQENLNESMLPNINEQKKVYCVDRHQYKIFRETTLLSGAPVERAAAQAWKGIDELSLESF